MTAGKPQRTVLFLQGPLSPLYRLLGQRLRQSGYAVYRINFSVGDWLHWHGEGCTSYLGNQQQWRSFLQDFIAEYNITSLVLHGDCRWYHQQAIDLAGVLDLEVIATELGALRPGWLTVEWGGLFQNSWFPSDPERIRELAAGLTPPESRRYDYPFSTMALYDVSYNLLNFFLCFLYPDFSRHTPHNPVIEYLRWIPRLLTESIRDRRARKLTAKLAADNSQYFLFPLQLNGDFQIRVHSPFPSLHQAMDLVLRSFALHAPAEAQLVLKQHPLDCGLDHLRQHARALAAELGIKKRLHYVDGGDLAELIGNALGVVTVNSTTGIEALQMHKPVKVMGAAFYDLPRLAHQSSLDEFWRRPQAPEIEYVDSLLRLLMHSTQVQGALYGEEGLATAVENLAAVIEGREYTPMSALGPRPRRKGSDASCAV